MASRNYKSDRRHDLFHFAVYRKASGAMIASRRISHYRATHLQVGTTAHVSFGKLYPPTIAVRFRLHIRPVDAFIRPSPSNIHNKIVGLKIQHTRRT